jgi:hypothetical protein
MPRGRAFTTGGAAGLMIAAVPALLLGGSVFVVGLLADGPNRWIESGSIAFLTAVAIMILVGLPLAFVGGLTGILLARFVRRDSRRRLLAQGALFGAALALVPAAVLFGPFPGPATLVHDALFAAAVFVVVLGALTGLLTSRCLADAAGR